MRYPTLVVVAISGFGQDGPMKYKTSFDLVNQATAGYIDVTGEPGRAPVRLGLAVGDLGGGLCAALGVVAGFVRRQCARAGSYVDVALQDVLIGLLGLLGPLAQGWLTAGESAERRGSQERHHVPSGAFRTTTGYLAISVRTDDTWARLVSLLAEAEGRRRDLEDERFANASGRVALRTELSELLADAFAQASTEAWLARMGAAGIECMAVHGLPDALDGAHAAARGLVAPTFLPGGAALVWSPRTFGSTKRRGSPRSGRPGSATTPVSSWARSPT